MYIYIYLYIYTHSYVGWPTFGGSCGPTQTWPREFGSHRWRLCARDLPVAKSLPPLPCGQPLIAVAAVRIAVCFFGPAPPLWSGVGWAALAVLAPAWEGARRLKVQLVTSCADLKSSW
jgi:hypothetical protein